MKLPKDMKLSPHARQRLLERKDVDIKYNTSNIMRSSVKWYGKDDLIHDCFLPADDLIPCCSSPVHFSLNLLKISSPSQVRLYLKLH